MSKITLTPMQMATLNVLNDSANSKGVIHKDTLLAYKQNVTLALIRLGALAPHYTNYKVATGVEIVERVSRESTILKQIERAANANPVGRPRLVRDEQLAA